MELNLITIAIGAFLFVCCIWVFSRLFQRPTYPIDNKRRPFSNDEKIAIAEKTIKKFGRAQCWHCGRTEDFEYDHITPLERGGHNGLDNLQILCKKCNTSKGARYDG